MSNHFCTFCRCQYPVKPPSVAELEANHERVLRELVSAKIAASVKSPYVLELEAARDALVLAAEQALGTMEWAEANVEGTNLQSDIILLRRGLQVARAR